MKMKKHKINWFKEIKSILGILFVILLFRSFVYEVFQIPSSSMVPSLLIGDMPVVEKWSYGYSKHSIIFSPPIFEGRIFFKQPKRGDVAVFRLPSNPSINYIKRVVGLPGDKIQVKEGVVYVNGEASTLTYKQDYIFEDELFNGKKFRMAMLQETFPNDQDRPHTIIRHDLNNISEMNNTPVYTVPEKHYFMMGDNRDFSQDSRFLSEVGYVHEDFLVGRAVCTLYSIANKVRLWEFWRWINNIRGSRILKTIE